VSGKKATAYATLGEALAKSLMESNTWVADWMRQNDLGPLDVVVCEECGFTPDGGTVTKVYFERKH